MRRRPVPIRKWPAAERPRERLLRDGPAALTDGELLAILCRTGRAGVSALTLARHLLARFGSLRSLDAAPAEALREIPGLGPAKIAQVVATLCSFLYFQEVSPKIIGFLPHFCREAPSRYQVGSGPP